MEEKIKISFGKAIFVTKLELPVMDKVALDTDWEKKFQKIKPEKTKGKYGIFPVGILNKAPKTSQNTKAWNAGVKIAQVKPKSACF